MDVKMNREPMYGVGIPLELKIWYLERAIAPEETTDAKSATR